MNLEMEKSQELVFRSNMGAETYMTIDSLVTMASKGFATCPNDSTKTGDFCASRKYSGADACECVRNAFPNPAYYELYLKLRHFYLQNVGRAFLAKLAGDLIEENNA